MYGQSLQQMGYGNGFSAAMAPQLQPGQGYGGGYAYEVAPQMQYPQVGMWNIGEMPQEYGAGGYGQPYGQPGGVFTPVAYASGYPNVGLWEIGASAQQQQFQPVILPPAQAPGMTMRQPQLLPGTRLTPKIPSNDRVLWLGFRFLNIAASANQVVTSRPQDTFAPRKVVIPSSVAPNFELADIRIGAISQLSSADPIPAEAFIPNAALTDVHFDTAQISQDVVFSVNNISNAAASFRASMNGFVVRA